VALKNRIAAVSTASYLGFLVGPPAIGVTADHLTLRGGLAIVAGLGALIALLAPAVGPAGRSERAASAPDREAVSGVSRLTSPDDRAEGQAVDDVSQDHDDGATRPVAIGRRHQT